MAHINRYVCVGTRAVKWESKRFVTEEAPMCSILAEAFPGKVFSGVGNSGRGEVASLSILSENRFSYSK